MSMSTPTPNRGQQRNRLPIDPHLFECVAAIEPSSACLSCHNEEKHFLENRCPARSHFGHFSENDRAVCTMMKSDTNCSICPGWLPPPGACHALRPLSSPVCLPCLTCSACASPFGGGKGGTTPLPPLLNPRKSSSCNIEQCGRHVHLC